jgi:hypothetical protein
MGSSTDSNADPSLPCRGRLLLADPALSPAIARPTWNGLVLAAVIEPGPLASKPDRRPNDRRDRGRRWSSLYIRNQDDVGLAGLVSGAGV